MIQWKIKYRKYKALSQPKACTRCNQRTVKKAYHVLCRDCAIGSKQCAKCMKSASEVEIIPAEPSEKEKLMMDIEMKQLVAALPERKRRTFLRFMNGKKKNKRNKEEDDENPPEEVPVKMPTRSELMDKIATLKLSDDPRDELDFSDDDDEDISFSSDDEFSE